MRGLVRLRGYATQRQRRDCPKCLDYFEAERELEKVLPTLGGSLVVSGFLLKMADSPHGNVFFIISAGVLALGIKASWDLGRPCIHHNHDKKHD